MLSSLKIENYRSIKNLRVNSLKRINLITGQNNTGKSTVLEAVAIFATKGDFQNIFQLLTDRGEYYRQNDVSKNITDYNIKSLSSLFANRHVGFSNKYSSTHKSKAKIHTWLSWQEDPGTPMGLAITKRYLTVNDTNCSMLINWILKLYK